MRVKENDNVRLSLERQGEIIVDGQGSIHRAGIRCHAIEIGVRSKYFDIIATGEGADGLPAFMLTANERTLNKHKSGSDHTKVSLPDYIGWDIWSIDSTKSSVRLCMVKR